MQVTALAWHPDHADYLAAGYGSIEFMYQGGGAIACFSLKNATTPEHQYTIDSGVASSWCLGCDCCAGFLQTAAGILPADLSGCGG
jgi:hypothetical protein